MLLVTCVCGCGCSGGCGGGGGHVCWFSVASTRCNAGLTRAFPLTNAGTHTHTHTHTHIHKKHGHCQLPGHADEDCHE